jgi:DNA-binding MarR family transcriptional regulator
MRAAVCHPASCARPPRLVNVTAHGSERGIQAPEDEVDAIVAAWHRGRPDLDLEPLHVLSRVTRLARHLDRARRISFAEHDLEASEFDVLAALRRSGEPFTMSPGQLVAQTMVTSGTMTHRVQRLVDKGLVERLPDPEDGRGVQVQLTERGRTQVEHALTGLLDRERQLLAGLTAHDREALADLLRRILVPLDDSDGAG